MHEPLLSDVWVLERRAAMAARYGAGTLDVAIVEFACPACARVESAGALRLQKKVGYASFVELLEVARVLAEGLRAKETPPCPKCNAPTTFARLHYHAFHTGLAKDLVVRCTPSPDGGALAQEALTWSREEGYARLARLRPAEHARFRRDALFRAAAVTLGAGDDDGAAAALEAVLHENPGDPDLLGFLPWAFAAGKLPLAAAVAEGHRDAHPGDPEGPYWMGETLLVGLMQGVVPGEAAEQADALFAAALALAPDHYATLLGRSRLARLRGRPDEARSSLERVVAAHPDRAEGRFNLGLLVLDTEPARALELFAAGEALSPEDGDYPIGRARALIALGRLPEARAALARGRELAPKHPRLAELEAKLAAD